MLTRKSESTKIENRKTKRHLIIVPLEIESDEFGKYKALGTNISEKGIFIQTWDPLPLGTKITIKIGDIDGFYISGVVRSHYYMTYRSSIEPSSFTGMGVKFGEFKNTSPISLFLRQTLIN
jgi:hypothetical protein